MAEDTGIAVVEGENPPAEVVETETPVSDGIDVDALWGTLESKVQSKIHQETRHLETRLAATEAKYQMALDYMAQEFDDDWHGDRAMIKKLIAQGFDAEEAAKIRDDVKLRREIAAVRAQAATPPKQAPAPAPKDEDADPKFQSALEHVWRSLTAYGESLGVDYQALYDAGKFGTKTPPPSKNDPYGLVAYEDKARKGMRDHKAELEKRANPTPAPSATAARGGDGSLPSWEKAMEMASKGELSAELYEEMLAKQK